MVELGRELLHIYNARKKFDDHLVLDGINLTLVEHEVVALIGASGSGKSTLLRSINLIEPLDSGKIVFDGNEITAKNVKLDQIRQQIGLIFQAYNLFPHMSVLENVMIAPRKVLKLDKTQAKERAHQLLDRIGLWQKRDAYPDQLSGGQKQRVAIVRALAMKPKVLLLDEVTSALDPELVGEVLEIIRELAHDGMTMLLATHEMSFAREIAHRVCFLDQGNIVEEGTPQKMFTNPQHERTQEFLRRVLAAGRL